MTKSTLPKKSDGTVAKQDTASVKTVQKGEAKMCENNVNQQKTLDTVKYGEKFTMCVEFVLDREGRTYENNPADPGGETAFGISKRAYPNLDIKSLTEDKAKDIYFNDYWLKMHCDSFETKKALCIFDCAVNQGIGVANIIINELVAVNWTVELFLIRRLRHYVNLCEKNSHLNVFLIDWSLRIVKLQEYKI